jgi:hypothetical protein
MTVPELIDCIEADFSCELGAPWRWADLGMSKPYTTITHQGDEYNACARLMTTMTHLKQKAGYRGSQRPRLYWRWADKVRYADGEIQTRVYLDGNPFPDIGNPQKPSGRPTVGLGEDHPEGYDRHA